MFKLHKDAQLLDLGANIKALYLGSERLATFHLCAGEWQVQFNFTGVMCATNLLEFAAILDHLNQTLCLEDELCEIKTH